MQLTVSKLLTRTGTARNLYARKDVLRLDTEVPYYETGIPILPADIRIVDLVSSQPYYPQRNISAPGAVTEKAIVARHAVAILVLKILHYREYVEFSFDVLRAGGDVMLPVRHQDLTLASGVWIHDMKLTLNLQTITIEPQGKCTQQSMKILVSQVESAELATGYQKGPEILLKVKDPKHPKKIQVLRLMEQSSYIQLVSRGDNLPDHRNIVDNPNASGTLEALLEVLLGAMKGRVQYTGKLSYRP